MKPILEIQNIGKKYKVRGQESPYLTLRDSLSSGFRRSKKENEFWALEDVSFNVNPGESIGIIGRNGAGKSTLLKILSRITPPTKGQIVCRGRIASLLEVGTGFHPELSGRENIFLNGSILGLSKQEIKKQFDEIVDFSGVERFLDTPLKHFSSGMQLRLAFSVAAHLQPEILIVDEVLAVGDVAFQNKCLNKMSNINEQGKTVIIVSHHMPSLARLCSKAFILNEGKKESEGDVHDIIKLYLSDNSQPISSKEWSAIEAPGSGGVKLLSLRAMRENKQDEEVFDIRNPICIEFRYTVDSDDKKVSPAFHLSNGAGEIVFISIDFYNDNAIQKESGEYISYCSIPGNLLSEDTFFLRGILTEIDPVKAPNDYVSIKDVISFQVIDKMQGGSARHNHKGQYYGVVRPILNWETDKIK